MILRLTIPTLLSLRLHDVLAFTPTSFIRPSSNTRSSTHHSAFVDPTMFSDAPQHMDPLYSFFSSITLSDATPDLVDAVTSSALPSASEVVDTVTAAASTAVDTTTAAAPVVADGNGWFGFLAGPIEALLDIIHSALVAVGVSEDAWGASIIAMTVFIKILTYPLTKSQLESTNKMQVLQPTIKDIQAKYQSNPEVMNQKIAEVYQTNEVNPLAGCIPTLVQLPVFVGLYRSVLNLAKENKLDEPFLFLPNLEGPTYGADPAHGSDWLFQGWVDGVPSLGWDDTIAFLIVPVFLVVSQFASMELMAPKNQEQPAFLKVLPLMIGYFSLTFPAALGIYWAANNVITTALSLQIRSSFQAPAVVGPSSGGASNVVDVQSSSFTPAPMREKPAGFGNTDWSDDAGDAVKPITPIDAEVVASSVTEGDELAAAAMDSETKTKKKRGAGKKKKKRRN